MDDRHYSPATYTLLRNVRLLDEGELDGRRFVRCIPRGTAEERRAVVMQAVREIDEPGVFLSNNPNYGGDYLRVDVTTRTFRLICHMKS